MENNTNLLVKYDTEEIAKKAPLGKVYDDDAGIDLYNASGQIIPIFPHRHIMISAGISIKLPENTCALLYPRSSTFVKRGLFIVNGLIDCGFTGPIYTIVWHPCLDGKDEPILIKPWERIAQLVVLHIPHFNIITSPLPFTARGKQGFGSSGF